MVSIKTFGEAAADITRTTTTFRPGNYGLDFQPRLLFINRQLLQGRMSDADIAALGGPDASGIPSAPAGGGSVPVPPPRFNNPVLSGGQVTITWTGTGTLLESTDLINWATVPGNPTS